jgi:hypothetical protein
MSLAASVELVQANDARRANFMLWASENTSETIKSGGVYITVVIALAGVV